MSAGALSDIRILDLTQGLSGPFATMMLADQGAEVIKIEPPSGDAIRSAGPFRDDDTLKELGGYFQSVNRNKKSVVFDLKIKSNQEEFLKLVETSDAVVENFRPGVMEKFGLGYETLSETNAKIVYGALRGFGDPRTGASQYTAWPALDVVAQAMGGLMGVTGPDKDSPTKIGPGLGDTIPGMQLAFGVLAAIHHARRTGQGQFVDVSMIDCVLSNCERIVYQHSVTGAVPGPEGNSHPFFCPFGIFPAKDGHVTIAGPQDHFFDFLCDAFGAKELKSDPRFRDHQNRGKNKDALIPLISEKTAQFTKAELTKKLGGHIPFGPVFNVAEIFADDHFRARDMIVDIEQPGSATHISIAGVPIKMTRTPGGVRARAPTLGEHNELYLREYHAQAN